MNIKNKLTGYLKNIKSLYFIIVIIFESKIILVIRELAQSKIPI